jgi:glycogen debranching enzyme
MSELVNLSETTVLKLGNAYCMALRDGCLPLEEDHPLGVYVDDCRHLRGYELRVGGQPPRLLIGSDSPGTAAVFELTNQPLELPGGRVLPLQSLRLRVERRLAPGAMVERISVHSYAREPVALDLELAFDADFSPMLEVRGMVEAGERQHTRTASGHTLRIAAVGADGVERSTTVTCPSAVATDDGRLRASIELQPAQETTLDLRFAFAQREVNAVEEAGDERADGHGPLPHVPAEADAWLAERLRIDVDDELLQRVLRRSLLDMRTLVSQLDGHRYFSAGVPWYATLFGRDSIISAYQMLPVDRSIAEETLRLLASRLGTRVDDRFDEEPGKVLHELRVGEPATLGLTPLARYYGTVDATALFLCLLCEHTKWSGSLDLFLELRPQVEQALRWIDEFADLDGDGLIEYRCRAEGGLDNQGWKDSWDAIVDEHGELLEAPIALVEVQGYAMAAKQRMGRLFELAGDADRADELQRDADRFARGLERFWLPERGFYAMALDAAKRPSRALASNQGHLLWSNAIPRERAVAVQAALSTEGAYSGWGVRTLSADELAFNPVGYHTGTVWPHDNALYAAGLRRYGFDRMFLRLFEDLLDAAAHFPEYRLPELYAGFARSDYEAPVPYPVACSPQAWAAGSLPFMLISGLGLTPNCMERRLCILRPSLPRQVSRLELRGLRIGDASVDLLFERVAGRPQSVALTDVHIDGDVDVVLQIEPGRDEELVPLLDDVEQTAGVAT